MDLLLFSQSMVSTSAARLKPDCTAGLELKPLDIECLMRYRRDRSDGGLVCHTLALNGL